jgi:hypothetical protein
MTSYCSASVGESVQDDPALSITDDIPSRCQESKLLLRGVEECRKRALAEENAGVWIKKLVLGGVFCYVFWSCGHPGAEDYERGMTFGIFCIFGSKEGDGV